MGSMNRFLPLIVVSTIHFLVLALSVYSGFYFSEREVQFQLYFEAPFLVSCASLIIISLTLFAKKDLWAFLFLIYLVVSLFPVLSFGINFTLSFGTLQINLISFVLLFWHYNVNRESLQINQTKNEDIERRIEQKKLIFKKQYEKKTLKELERIEVKNLVPEAQEVLEEILQIKRNNPDDHEL